MLDEMALTLPGRGTYVLRLEVGDTTYRATIYQWQEGDVTLQATEIRTPWRETPVEAYAAAVRRLLFPEFDAAPPQRRRRKDAGDVRLSLVLKGGK